VYAEAPERLGLQVASVCMLQPFSGNKSEAALCTHGTATASYNPARDPLQPLCAAARVASVLLLLRRRGGIMLTTYGMVLHNASQLMSGKGSAVARGAQARRALVGPTAYVFLAACDAASVRTLLL
jgi:hypothetical protein